MVATRYPNTTCPACRRPLAPDDRVRGCPACELSYHARCWERRGGCVTAGCAHAPRPPEPRAAAAPRGAAPDTVPPPDAELAAAARAGERSRPWLIALAAVVVCAVALTVTLGVLQSRRSAAVAGLQDQIAAARASGGDAAVVTLLEQALARGGPRAVVALAEGELDAASTAVDDAAFAAARAAGAEHDALSEAALAARERALLEYVQHHPQGRHRREAQEALARIPAERDENAFRRAGLAARAAGDDFAAQAAAWQEYLAMFPDGQFAAQARAQLAALPERADEALTRQVLAAAERLASDGNPLAALDRLAEGRAAVRGAARRARLAAAMTGIEEQLEPTDAAACLSAPAATPAERAAALAACRLYLLCYPTGAQRAAVAARAAELEAEVEAARLAEFHARLAQLADDPQQMANLLDAATADPELRCAALDELRARAHVALLRRQVHDSLGEAQYITLRGNTRLLGEVRSDPPPATGAAPSPRSPFITPPPGATGQRTAEEWVDIVPRAAPGAGAVQRVPRSDVIRTITPPLLARLDALCEQLDQTPVGTLDPTALADELDGLAAGLTEPYAPERAALKRGAAILRASTAPSAGAADALDVAVEQARAEQHFTGRIRQDTRQEVDALVRDLPAQLEFDWLAMSVRVPVAWRVQAAPLVPDRPADDDAFWALRVPVRYTITAERQGDAGLPLAARQAVDAQLAGDLGTIQVTYDVQVRGELSMSPGYGLRFARSPAGPVVRGVGSGSSGAAAGVAIGDRLVEVAGGPAAGLGLDELEALLATLPARGASLTLARSGRRFTITLDKRATLSPRYQMQVTRRIVDLTGSGVAGEDVRPWAAVAGPP